MNTLLFILVCLLLIGICQQWRTRARGQRVDEAAMLAQLEQMEADMNRAARDDDESGGEIRKLKRQSKPRPPKSAPEITSSPETSPAAQPVTSRKPRTSRQTKRIAACPQPIADVPLHLPFKRFSFFAVCLHKIRYALTPVRILVRPLAAFARTLGSYFLRRPTNSNGTAIPLTANEQNFAA